MKYRLPDDCTGLSHDGTQLTITDDGTVELDAAAARALAPHGVYRAADPRATERPDDGSGRERSERRGGPGRR